MLNGRLARIEAQLKAGLGRSTLKERGRRSRFERRTARVITTTEFVTSLLQSLGTRRIESLADLHRDFNADHGTTVNYKPYYERLDSRGFVELMRSLFEDLLSTLYQKALSPLRDSALSIFEDVVIHDGSSFALHDDLAGTFPGRFTTISPAAVELHATMSLLHDNLISLTLSPDSECERHNVPAASELGGKLFLADRGYDSTAFMEEIQQAGGSFCIRTRTCLDPFVARIHRRGARYRQLEGKRLSTVIGRLAKGKVYDLDIEWRRRDGTPRNAYRMLLRYQGPEHGWMRLMTNLARDRFADHDVLRAYRLRWQVELYFKELKSYANLHAFSTSKPHIAEGLIWASLCVAFLKRFFAHGCQQATASAAISTRRVAMCSHVFLRTFFQCLRAGFRNLRQVLEEIFAFLAVNARRANPRRERKRGRLALNLVPAGVSLR